MFTCHCDYWIICVHWTSSPHCICIFGLSRHVIVRCSRFWVGTCLRCCLVCSSLSYFASVPHCSSGSLFGRVGVSHVECYLQRDLELVRRYHVDSIVSCFLYSGGGSEEPLLLPRMRFSNLNASTPRTGCMHFWGGESSASVICG